MKMGVVSIAEIRRRVRESLKTIVKIFLKYIYIFLASFFVG